MSLPVPNPYAWYDASQISGVADGAALATWPDLSGNGFDLKQATAAAQPIYYSSTALQLINGLPTVHFDGSDDEMQTAAFPSPVAQPDTIYVVGGAFGGGAPTFYDGLTAANRQLLYDAGPGSFAGYAGATGIVNAATTNLQIIAIVFAGATSSALSLQNLPNVQGSLPLTALSLGTDSLDGLTVGANYAGTSGVFLNGPLAEVLIYKTNHTYGQLKQMMAYLIDKWVLATPAPPPAAGAGPAHVFGS